MKLGRKTIMLGTYAVYFRSLSDTLIEHRRLLFGDGRMPAIERPGASVADTQQPETAEAGSKKSKKPESDLQKLENAVEKTQKILIESRAVFPFDMFPDSITIDRQRLTVVHRAFFSSKQTASVQHSDVKNIQADMGPFLGSLTITSDHFINNTQTINYLPKKEVLAIQQLVQGFIIANTEGVDLSTIDDEKLVELLDKLGRGEATERVAQPGK